MAMFGAENAAVPLLNNNATGFLLAQSVSPLDVLWYTLPMALATGLGTLPFFFLPSIGRRWVGLLNAFAAGVMMTTSYGLVFEAMYSYKDMPHTPYSLASGLVLGLIFINVSQKWVERHEKNIQWGSLEGLDAKRALVVVAVMTLHSFSEGLGVGVSYGGPTGLSKGAFISAAIGIHNIPEGLAISLVIIPRGESKWRALLWSTASSLPQPLIAIPAFMFVETFKQLMPFGLGFAAGTMIWMVFAHILPDCTEYISPSQTGTAITASSIAMILFQSMIMEH